MGAALSASPLRSQMKSAVVLVFTCLAAARADFGSYDKVRRTIDDYNFFSKCWGEKNMDLYLKKMIEAGEKCMKQENPLSTLASLAPPQTNPFSPLPVKNPLRKLIQSGGDISQLPSLWRTKRQASNGLLSPDEEDIFKFIYKFKDFKSDMVSKMGNLSCVLKEMKMLTPEGDINIELYTSSVTTPEEGVDYDVEGSALSDPEFRQKISDSYNDCYKLSESWPESSLDKSPITKIFGRHLVFFKCARKAETHLCGKAQILQWLEKLYGPLTPEEQAERIEKLRLPEDKYDAAAISLAVMINAASVEEKFVNDFFWGMGEH